MLNFDIRRKYFSILTKKILDIYEIITGIPPLSLPNSKGKNLKSYSISGNVDEEIIEYSDGTAIEGKPNLLRTAGRTNQAVSGNAQTKRILQGDKYVFLTANNNVSATTEVTLTEGGVSFSKLSDGHGVAFPVKLKPNYNYTAYANVSATTTTATMNIRISFYEADGTWISTWYQGNATNNGMTLKSFTVPSNADMTLIVCAKNNTETGTAPTITFSNIMLIEGVYTTSNAPAYTPYKQLLTDIDGVGDKTKNLLLLKGRTEQTSIGGSGTSEKRILDCSKYAKGIAINNSTVGYTISNVQITADGVSCNITAVGGTVALPVKLASGLTYSISSINSSGGQIRIIYYQADGTFGGEITTTSSGIVKTFTVPSDADVTVILLRRAGSANDSPYTFSNIMLVEGSYTSSTMPAYEQFSYKIPVLSSGTHNIIINNSLFKTGESVDTVNYPQNKTIKAVGKYEFTGNETIELYDNSKGFRFTVSDMETGNCIDGFCNRFENFKNVTDNDVPRVFFGYNNNYVYFRRFSDTATTAEAIKEILASWYSNGKPLTIWYPLEDETEEAVTLPDIPTVRGNATIMIDTEVQPSEISVEYAVEGA